MSSEPSYLSHRQILVVLGGLMAGMFLAALDQSIVGTALPRVVSDLGGVDQMAWVVTTYMLTATASTTLWGKLSDLFGRRPMFQVSISIFLLGSVLSAMSASMVQLVAFRAVQGIGGGGLMALAFAIIADVIPARERGRYMGYMGAVFGTSSVAGPLLGGFFTDGPGWRWIFWINLPIGIAGLIVTSIALRNLSSTRRTAKVDWAGATAIVTAASSLVLYLSWRGTAYGWTETWALVLLGLGLLATVAFILIESRVAEPIIPLRLFRGPIYAVGNVFNFMFGFAMFGAVLFVPLYFQVVQGTSPTESGLRMLPMVAGILSASIITGRLMSSTGRYKIFPILGSVGMVTGILLLSTMGVETPLWRAGLYMFVLGIGLGSSMQTVATAIQNSVPTADMGSATSSIQFFRQMGGVIGSAIFGAILANRLAGYLADALPAAVVARIPEGSLENVEFIHQLPAAIREPVIGAYVEAISDTFLTSLPFAAAALITALFLKEIPLATRGGGSGAAEAPSEVSAGPSAAGTAEGTATGTAGGTATGTAGAGASTVNGAESRVESSDPAQTSSSGGRF